MRKKLIQIIIISIIVGIIITLITGLFSNQENFLGSSRWGYPLHWLSRMIVGPQYSPPLNIVWLNLIIDIVIWSIIVLVILLIVFRKNLFRKEKKEMN
ncbi:MAG: hypothetical protein KAW45_01815 [Thermoplasmatales archaeon]|nr:hypothetical protein [Thermoplasmatales archaeon]